MLRSIKEKDTLSSKERGFPKLTIACGKDARVLENTLTGDVFAAGFRRNCFKKKEKLTIFEEVKK